MINIITVKESDKYGPEYVNRLKVMLHRNLRQSFTMWCYTDDPAGIEYGIEIIPIPEEYHLEHWWNKVAIFNKEMPYSGRCLYLDLDTVIQNNIDDIIDYEPNHLCGVWTWWNDVYTDGDYSYKILRHKIPFNSSVMTWNKDDYTWVWDKFWEDHNEYIMKYYGDDKYLGNEIDCYNAFPKSWIYSRLYGDGENEANDKISLSDKLKTVVHYYEDAKICLLNGPTSEPHYERFKPLWQ